MDVELYGYDVNSNRTSYEQPGAWNYAAEYDDQDRLVQMGGTVYQFNADGQLTQRGTDLFQYSAQGELLQATVEGQTITYTYDGTGRRVARTDSTGTTQYLYGNQSNPFQLTAMRDPAGVLSNFYYDNVGSLFTLDKGGVRYYVAADQVGTPKVVTDATGAVVKFMEFDSFGMPTFDSNPEFNLPVGFAAGLTDDKTGLVRFGYRDYEPDTGRWTAKDPIFFGGGQGNLYVYVENNPVNYTDPDGNLPLPVWGAIVTGVGFIIWEINYCYQATRPSHLDTPNSDSCKKPESKYPKSPGGPRNFPPYQPPLPPRPPITLGSGR